MSTYYEFYAAVKKDDKIEAIGPYMCKDGEYQLVPILTRSRSFICFDEFGCWDLPIEKMTDDQVEFFSSEGWMGDERHSISCHVPYTEICALADDGLVQGYVTLEELNAVAASDYHPDALWDVWVRTPEMAAEMDPETRKHMATSHMSTIAVPDIPAGSWQVRWIRLITGTRVRSYALSFGYVAPFSYSKGTVRTIVSRVFDLYT